MIKPFAELSYEEIQNEFRAVEKFGRNSSDHLVAVFNYGRLPESPYYFIDMELGDMDLDQYIYPDEPDNRNLDFQSSLPIRTDVNDIWKIMRDISNGLTFIHNHMETHRDIKPKNGICLSLSYSDVKFCIFLNEGFGRSRISASQPKQHPKRRCRLNIQGEVPAIGPQNL